MSATGTARPDPRDHRSEHQAERLRDGLERANQYAARMQKEYDEVLADPSVIQEDRDAAARLLEHARGELDSARSAVERLDAGAYGRCTECGDDIGAERLAALVDVATCVTCAG